MSLIKWKNEFSIGIPAVDYEHRQLIELINDLHAEIGAGAAPEHVLAALGEIFAQISSHFALEERFMRDTKYPSFPAHKQDHEALLDDLRDIMERLERHSDFDEVELSRDLEAWFSVHFRTHDAKLHRHADH